MKAKASQEQVRAHLTIEGLVQGVFFRAATLETATRLGVKGWVRNCLDGTVEVIAEGEKQTIDELVEWCHQGPPRAQVQRVQVLWEDHLGEFESFGVRR
ncbi:MAG: acylphosphatase [Deltaproteobacteria bacterium]|nr:acylphosphatase [Deltaproteobacteria bacterium]